MIYNTIFSSLSIEYEIAGVNVRSKVCIRELGKMFLFITRHIGNTEWREIDIHNWISTLGQLAPVGTISKYAIKLVFIFIDVFLPAVNQGLLW